ncbi:MBL fold metallo-hydrolase [Flammeovirga aprica]|uniref:MBL fold metallo-hydrolase n=1 Tax=Flammeovirga aprica JL-4 TaxID=694437 RepID=A0A7X9RZA7_9BACT|nr:MBL fold metallo-hydrolase [Flammeovirga aprica]NME71377.1 MBL fold metallo-hydrolase [Flammeovirga aprica JL-4]
MITTEELTYENVKGYRFGYSPFGKPNLSTYIYFIDGLLIDTGQSKVRKVLLDKVDHLPIEQIFITHHHEDHTGNIIPLKERFQCPIYSSEKCAEMMYHPPSISFAQKITWGEREVYHDLIPIENEIKTKHHTFEIIKIPGHAIDMVALYEPTQKWLFSADLYINSYIGYFLNSESIAQQISSIKKILAYDFKVMFCSHNPQLENPKQKLTDKLNFLESSFHSITELHHKGLDQNQIFKTLRWKENWLVKFLSGGALSKMNLIKAVIRDVE